MKKISIFLLTLISVSISFNITPSYSQMKFGVGTVSCLFNGDTISFGLNTDLNDQYYMANGGTADFGLIKIQWDGAKSPKDVKVQTLELKEGFVYSDETKISVIWADFYTNLPNIIKKGMLTITENDGSTIRGMLEITAKLGGSDIFGDLLKGKKESVLKNGYFEIKY